MAPVFDNGRSLFFNHGFGQVDDFAAEAQFVLPSWPQVTFDEQAARLIGERQVQQLERLASLEFRNSDEHPLPDEFLRSLSAFIRRRAEELAALPPGPRDEMRARAGL